MHSAKEKVESNIFSTNSAQDQTVKEKQTIVDEIFATPNFAKEQREHEQRIVFLGVPDYDY